MSNHTPGPWKACNDGKCPCKQVWSAGHPIADVIHGPWGDPYPALEISGGELNMTAKPVIRMIEYGTVPEETATANARLIAAAPELLEALEKIVAMNVQHAIDQYGDAGRAEHWSCVTVARAAIARAKGEGGYDSESAE